MAAVEGKSQELIEVLQKVVQNAAALLEVRNCAIALLDAQRTKLGPLAALWEDELEHEFMRSCLHLSTGEVAHWVVEHGEGLLIHDSSLDPHCTLSKGMIATAMICVPLIDDGYVIGVLGAYDRKIGAFSQKQLRLLEIFAQQAMLAITHIKQTERVQARLLSMMTHELRAPLNTIHGYLDLALSGVGGDLNTQQCEFIQRARAGSEQLFALLENLLLLSRADIGQLRIQREVMRLQDVVENAVEEMELTAKDHGITITVAIAQDFPPLYADAVKLQQVLRNLLSNALRFTEQGGRVLISAHVEDIAPAGNETASSAEDKRVVILEVSDTGRGIATDVQERIFARSSLWGVREGNERPSGQGIGLSIVKMIVELHGGYVRVESVMGEGSTFICVLPSLLA